MTASTYSDSWLLDGVRTPFADYNGALASVSPIDLGIKAARAAFAKTGVAPQDVGTVITGNMAQASFDAYMLPRHIGLYSGVPQQTPAHMVQRVCGTGIEVLAQASDAVSLGRAELALCVGTESMSRNPVVSYTSRGGFRMGQVEFKDFLWEALLDPACGIGMGDTAENLARRYQITRPEVDAYAARSFARAMKAQNSGFLAGEITSVASERFAVDGLKDRGIRIKDVISADSHIRTSTEEQLAKIKPAFGGVQTGGNSSAIVDGAAAILVGSARYAEKLGKGRWRALSRAPPSACRRRSWASGRYRQSKRCWSAPDSSSMTSAGSRSTKPSAPRSWPAPANLASTRTSSMSTAERSPSVIRLAPPASGWR